MFDKSSIRKAWLAFIFAATLLACDLAHALPSDPPLAQQLDQQATDLFHQGQYEQALPLALRALALRETALGAVHPLVYRNLIMLAGLYSNLGQTEEALPLLQRVLAITKKWYGPGHPTTAQALQALASLYVKIGRYEQALPLFQRALAISEKANGPNHPMTARSLNDLALLYLDMGRYEQALPLIKRALIISEKANGSDHPSTGESLANLASIYQAMGRYEEALPLFQRALAILEKANGPDHPSTGAALNNLAALYVNMGHYEQALSLDQRALAISEKARGPGHPLTGMSANNLAELYRDMGRYEQALPLYQRALAILEKANGPGHPSTGTILNNLALLDDAMGRYEQALPLFQRALAISEKANGPGHPLTAQSMNNLAGLYRDMGRYEQALPFYQRALAISEKANGPDHPMTALSLQGLALLDKHMGRYEEALPLVQRALAISERANGPGHPLTALSVNNLAEIYRDMDRYEQALPLFQRALAIVQSGGDPILLWGVQYNCMTLYGEQHDAAPGLYQPGLAIWYGKQAVNTLQSLRAEMKGLQRELQDGFLHKYEDTYQRLANLLTEQGRIAEAERVLDMLKDRELFELTRAGGAELTSRQVDYVGVEQQALDESRRLAAQAVKDSAELAGLEKRMRAGQVLSETEQARRQTLLQAAQAWRAQYQRFLSELSQSFAEAARRPVKRDAESQATRLEAQVAQDSAGAIGLHYTVADDRVGIIVSTSRGSFGRFSNIKRRDLAEQIRQLREAVMLRKDMRPLAQALWRVLIEPVRADIQAAGAKTLVLSLTDELRYLPFAVLQDPQERYLVEDYALALWAAAADTRAARSDTPWSVSALGLTQARPGFSALKSVRLEVTGIVRTLDGSTDAVRSNDGVLPGQIVLDEQFTSGALEQALTGPNNVVHIASHFDFHPGSESNSVLLLGQGELSLGQLNVMDFQQVQQLTLSACETAYGGGRNENGAEVEGLAAVVLRQRAQAVLATLWKVDDASTAQLMREFYAAHSAVNPLTRAQALRLAQLNMLRGSVKPVGNKPNAQTHADWKHPYYWAPFVLSGNWL